MACEVCLRIVTSLFGNIEAEDFVCYHCRWCFNNDSAPVRPRGKNTGKC